MATATATPPRPGGAGRRAQGPAAQLRRALGRQEGLGAPRAAAARPVFIVIMTQLPFVATIVISFMNWNANYPDEIGFGRLHNFVTVFTDAEPAPGVLFTILLTVTVVLVSLVLGPRASRCC